MCESWRKPERKPLTRRRGEEGRDGMGNMDFDIYVYMYGCISACIHNQPPSPPPRSSPPGKSSHTNIIYTHMWVNYYLIVNASSTSRKQVPPPPPPQKKHIQRIQRPTISRIFTNLLAALGSRSRIRQFYFYCVLQRTEIGVPQLGVCSRVAVSGGVLVSVRSSAVDVDMDVDAWPCL